MERKLGGGEEKVLELIKKKKKCFYVLEVQSLYKGAVRDDDNENDEDEDENQDGDDDNKNDHDDLVWPLPNTQQLKPHVSTQM